MAEVIGTLGNEIIELNNAATEATLQALLQSSTKSAAAIAALASRSGVQIDADSIEKTNTATKGASASAGLFSSKLNESSKQIVQDFSKLGSKLLDGTVQSSSLFEAFSSLPYGIGKVAKGFQLLTEYQEENLKVYQQITSAGVNFAGSLTELRLSLAGARLTSDEFSRIVTQNSEAFLKLGTTVNNGAKNFLSFSQAFLDGEVGTQMRALGFTTEQLNSGLATYISATGGRNRQEMQNTEALTKGARAYFEQLDALTQLTGTNREELEKEQKERAANAAFENYLLTLDVKEREKANAAMTEAMARGGKGARDALMSRLMGLPPLTEAGQKFMTVTKNASASFGLIIEKVRDGTASIDDIRKVSVGITAGLIKDGKENADLFRVLVMQGGDLAEISQKALAVANKARIQGIESLTDEEQRLFLVNQAIKERAEKSEAETMVSFKKAIEDLGILIQKGLTPIVEFLTNNALKPLSGFIQNAVIPAMQNIGTYINDVLWPGFISLFTTVKSGLEPVFDGLKFAIQPIITLFGDLATATGQSLKESFTTLSTFIKENINPYLEKFGKFLKDDVTPQVEKFGKFIKDEVLPAFSRLWTSVSSGLEPIFKALYSVMQNIVMPILSEVMSNFIALGKFLKDMFTPVMNRLGEIIDIYINPALKKISSGYETLATGFKNLNDKLEGGLIKTIGLVVTALIGLKVAAIGASAVGLKRDSSILPSRSGAPTRTSTPPATSSLPAPTPATSTTGNTGSTTSKKAKAAALAAGVIGGNVLQNEAGKQEEGSALSTLMDIAGTGAEWAGYGALLGPKGAAVAGLAGLIYESGKSIWKNLFGNSKNNNPPPDIPAFANGGIVTKPTLGLIGEGKSAEAVIPLDKLETMLSTAMSTNTSKQEILAKELETLNKQTAEVIRYLRETADYTKQNVDATKSLNGDLFRF